MRTKRQPTIKTLFLLMAVVAVQCATISELVKDIEYSNVFWEARWWGLLSGIFFWSLLPLIIALLVRSARRAAAVGLGFGLFSLLMTRYSNDVSVLFWSDDNIEFAFGLRWVLWGPFLCINSIMGRLWGAPLTDVAMLPEIVMVYAVFIFYMPTCFLIARSCRLREQAGSST